MSRQQARHFKEIVTKRDKRLVKMAQRLRVLQRQWAEPEPQQPRHLRDMTPPSSGYKLALWTAQNGLCAYCHGPLLPRYHVDHIHPKSKGGLNHPSNYCLACQPCNLAKHDKPAEVFRAVVMARSESRYPHH